MNCWVCGNLLDKYGYCERCEVAQLGPLEEREIVMQAYYDDFDRGGVM